MASITKLWQRKKFADYQSNFEREYDREILFSERKRSFIISLVSAFLVACFFIMQAPGVPQVPEITAYRFYGYNLFTWLAIVFGGLSLYELAYTLAIVVQMKRGRLFPILPRFLNAFIEISVPTALMYFTHKNYHSIQSLFTPQMLFYTFFIALSSLRLMFSLAVFTGLVAGAEYIALALYIIAHTRYDGANLWLFSPVMHISKGLMLMLAGLVTGIVALQIKKRMKSTLKTVDEKNAIVSMFGQHVSPAVVNKLLEQKGDLDSETRYVCMMFLDIRNFTKFAESREPGEVVDYLNTLFDFMIDIINAHNGIINKFLGDGFMAVFGAPFSDGRDSRNAINAAREIVARLSDEIAAGRIPQTAIGIGIHAGSAVTGNVGSFYRKEYTIIGDVVNLASRIEQLNKTYRSQILVSEEVWKAAEKSDAQAEDLGTVDIRGHSQTVHIYKLA